ncbi:RHS repeat domain-containing protein [Streptomyces sp. NPDC048385]|uniref:RHS repeat domain-containing protein n=1 Tax=unclassified Streptomyces TaxID=2593676 RepID=UPI003440A6BC
MPARRDRVPVPNPSGPLNSIEGPVPRTHGERPTCRGSPSIHSAPPPPPRKLCSAATAATGSCSVAVADTTGGDATRTTSWTYNTHDQVDSVTDPLGHETSYGYDAYGNRASETDADGNAYTYSYSPTCS